MKRLLDVVRWTLFVAALIVTALAAALYVAERNGWLALRLERELSARLNDDFVIERVELAWFEPRVELYGVHLRDAPDLARLDRVTVSMHWNGLQLPILDRVDVRGGRLVLGDELFTRIESRARAAATSVGEAPGHAPIVVVEGLQVDLAHPVWGGETALGRVDAFGRLDPEGELSYSGRIAPSFAASSGDAAHEIMLEGTRDIAGRSLLHVWASSLPVTDAAFLARSPLEIARKWRPRGELSLDLRASFDESGANPPSGHLRMRLEHGSAQPPTKSAPVEDVTVDLEASCTPRELAALLDPRSWENTVHASASWDQREVDAWMLAGRNAGAGLAARAWLSIPCVPLSEQLLEAFDLDENPIAATQWHALEPSGTAHLALGLEWPSAPTAEAQAATLPIATLEAELDGETGMCVWGWPSHGHTEGFPLAVDQLSGRVVVLHDPRAEHDTLIGIVRGFGAHSGGKPAERPAFVEGLLRWTKIPSTEPALDLRFGAHAVPIDERVRVALTGLRGTDFIAEQFDPVGGEASVAARIFKREDVHLPVVALQLDLRGVGARWHEMPARVVELDGRLELLTDPRHALGVGFELHGETAHGARVRVAGRLEDDPDAALIGRPWNERHLQAFEVDVEEIGLRGDDRAEVLTRQPDVREVLERLGPEGEPERGPQGRIDVAYRGATVKTGGAFAWNVEIAPRGEMQFTPQAFPVQWQAVRGRIIVAGEQPLVPGLFKSTGHARVVPLVGDWTKQTRVACVADLPFDGDRRIELFGSGIDVKNASLMGAFRTLSERYDSVNLDALRVNGRVDLTGDLRIPFAAPSTPEGIYRVRLRENDVRLVSGARGRASGLDRLSGILVQAENELRGERIAAHLASTPLLLREVRFFEGDDGFHFQTRFDALDVPLDAQHLSLFLDPSTVEALCGGLALRGKVDLDDARLEIGFASAAHGDIVRFAARGRAREAFVDIGLPLSIQSAEISIDPLVYEGNDVRVDATVSGLDGLVADRVLKNGELRFTYVEPHLSILELDAELEHGRLSGLANEDARGGSAFSMDLEQPYPFDLAVRLSEVEVAGLLRGLFESDFASSGYLSGELRLSGDLRTMTGIAGEGNVEMRDTVLWSIPVVREMFAQLGFDDIATFDRVRSRFQVGEGRIAMNDLRVSSALLKLVGSGTLDFDGTLHHDLQVQYELVDRLGPFKRLLYWVQNNLARVAVRGDMSRPRVEIKGIFGLMQGSPKMARALPLPSFAPLSARF